MGLKTEMGCLDVTRISSDSSLVIGDNRVTSAPSGNFDLVFQQGGVRRVGRLRSLAKSA